MNLKSHFAACTLIWALLSHASAQEEISLQFLSFPQTEQLEPVELVVGEGQTIKVDIPGNELSRPYKVPSLATIVVGKTNENVEKPEDPPFQVYGQAKAMNVPKQIILLIRKGLQNSDGFVVMPINAENLKFPGGSFLFINASNMNIGGSIGDKQFALRPGQQSLIKPKPDHPNNICQVTLSYKREEDWKTFYDTRWPSNEKYRSLVFFYQDPDSGRLGIVPIVDMQMN